MKRSICSLFVIAALGSVSTSALANNTWQDSAKDAWIDGKAETTLLLNGNLNSFDINTDVSDGTITLTGKVDSEVDKALAEELLASLDGVKGVENELTVVNNDKKSDSEMMQSLTDTKVETVVKTRLLLESEVRGTAIEVEVDKGVVTLKGKVDSDAAKDLAIAIAKNTDDVDSVVDNLTVAES
ncbi:MAG: BON domain-containing protein [Aliiglaciecola sp.]